MPAVGENGSGAIVTDSKATARVDTELLIRVGGFVAAAATLKAPTEIITTVSWIRTTRPFRDLHEGLAFIGYGSPSTLSVEINCVRLLYREGANLRSTRLYHV